MALTSALYLCALAALALIWRSQQLKKAKRLRLPPGPKGLPLLGNLLDLPQEESWKFHATDTLQKYGELSGLSYPDCLTHPSLNQSLHNPQGDVAYFSALGSHIIVLNSYDAAFDLLSRRSAIYSDRPTLPMAGELCVTPFIVSSLPILFHLVLKSYAYAPLLIRIGMDQHDNVLLL